MADFESDDDGKFVDVDASSSGSSGSDSDSDDQSERVPPVSAFASGDSDADESSFIDNTLDDASAIEQKAAASGAGMEVTVYIGRPITQGNTTASKPEDVVVSPNVEIAPESESALKAAGETELKLEDVKNLEVAQEIQLEKDFLVYGKVKDAGGDAQLIGKIHELPAVTEGVRAWFQPGAQAALTTIIVAVLAAAYNFDGKKPSEEQPNVVARNWSKVLDKLTSQKKIGAGGALGIYATLVVVLVIALGMAKFKSYQKILRCKYQWLSPGGDTVLFVTKTKVSPTSVIVTRAEKEEDGTLRKTNYKVTFIADKKGVKACLVTRDDENGKPMQVFNMDTKTIDDARWELNEVSNQKKTIFIPLVMSGKGTFDVPSNDADGNMLTPEMQQLYIFARVLFEFRNKTTVTAARRALSVFFRETFSVVGLAVVLKMALSFNQSELKKNPSQVMKKFVDDVKTQLKTSRKA